MMNDPRIIPLGQELPPMEEERPKRDRPAQGAPKRKKQAAGRFGMLNAFADDGARHVSTTAQACWWIIFRETKPDGRATVAHRRIAQCVGISRRTALRALKQLEQAGLLKVVRRGDFDTRHPSVYRLKAAVTHG